MKFEIKSRVTGDVLFSCELDAEIAGKSYSFQLGFAVKKAVEIKANLRSADLRYADLRYADLRYADLRYADLRSADLRYADLRSADLSYANLRYAKNSEYAIAVTRILPEGSIIGWKKLKGNVIAKLRIPEEAKRSHAFGRKCRAEYADVVDLFGADIGVSSHDNKTVYKAGERVMPDSFSDVWTDECAPGIHFFLTRLEAEAY